MPHAPHARPICREISQLITDAPRRPGLGGSGWGGKKREAGNNQPPIINHLLGDLAFSFFSCFRSGLRCVLPCPRHPSLASLPPRRARHAIIPQTCVASVSSVTSPPAVEPRASVTPAAPPAEQRPSQGHCRLQWRGIARTTFSRRTQKRDLFGSKSELLGQELIFVCVGVCRTSRSSARFRRELLVSINEFTAIITCFLCKITNKMLFLTVFFAF